MSRLARWRGAALTLSAALMAALALIAVIMLSLDKAPLAAAQRFIEGAIGTPSARADVIMAALPMLLCAAGLLLTFTAGLWNIGVEGQVTMGAIFATIIARTIPRDVSDWGIFAALIVPAELLLAMFGGALWAGLAALLKIRGGINEIFGGVALNFISVNILLSLVNGAWRVGTFPQTAPFAPAALLPRSPELRLSPLGIGIALAAFVLAAHLLHQVGDGDARLLVNLLEQRADDAAAEAVFDQGAVDVDEADGLHEDSSCVRKVARRSLYGLRASLNTHNRLYVRVGRQGARYGG